MLGTKDLCVVLSIRSDDASKNPGIIRNTVKSEQTMPLHSTRPKSIPMRSCITISAASPASVVSEDELISTIALLSAATIASYAFFVSFSSAKRCERIIE